MGNDEVVLTDSTKKIKAIILIGGPCKGNNGHFDYFFT